MAALTAGLWYGPRTLLHHATDERHVRLPEPDDPLPVGVLEADDALHVGVLEARTPEIDSTEIKALSSPPAVSSENRFERVQVGTEPRSLPIV